MQTCLKPLISSLLCAGALSALSAAASAQQPVTVDLPSLDVGAAKPAPARPPQATTSANVAPSEVVVSPTAVATPSENVASSVTVITARDLERDQRRTVVDALRAVPGLNVVQTGAVGGQTSIFMRGTNSNHVKVFIDGIDVSDPSVPTGAFDFGHLIAADVERIEVLRGPQSGLYGANSIGGVISITTQQGKGPARATAMFEGGSFGTFNQSASLSGSKGIFSYAFNVGHIRSMDTPVTPSELLAPGQKRINDAYDNWTYSTKLSADFSKYFTLNVVGRYTDATKFFTADDFSVAPFTGAIANEHSVIGVQQGYGRVEGVTTLFGGALKNYFSVARTSLHSVNVSHDGSTAVNDGDRVKVDWRNVMTVAPGQVFIAGVERKVETINTTGFTALQAGEWNNAGYLEYQSQIGRNLSFALNGRYDQNETFGGHATYRFAPALIVPGTDTKLKASVGSGFRAPTLNERFIDLSNFKFVGNPSLKPEESIGWDAGFEQPLFDNKFRFGVTYFHNDIKNLINSTTNPFPAMNTYENVAVATTWGYESFASWAVTRDLHVRGDYTFTRAFNETSGEELLRRPRHKASLQANWSPMRDVTLSGTVLYTGSWMDFDRYFQAPAAFQTNPYTLVNLAGSYKWSETVTLFARVDNLLDVKYQDPTGFLRPGLGVFGGVRLTSW